MLFRSGCACDVLLIDMNLPDGNGIELVAQVRRSLPAMTVLVLTGCGDEQAAVSALRSGADDYIIKDTRYLDDLHETIEAAVRRRQGQAAPVNHQVLHVLYAERTASDVDLLRRHLRQQAPHILIDAVGSAAEVIAALEHGSPDGLGPIDALLLDYLLPGMNALELVHEIREVQIGRAHV